MFNSLCCSLLAEKKKYVGVVMNIFSYSRAMRRIYLSSNPLQYIKKRFVRLHFSQRKFFTKPHPELTTLSALTEACVDLPKVVLNGTIYSNIDLFNFIIF